ncbi:hypothetical protein DFH28DRAFT_988271 [Melampsora americana]|nr:hypothetical protein DFH28DRAFT_988271 [Melampsora americana]
MKFEFLKYLNYIFLLIIILKKNWLILFFCSVCVCVCKRSLEISYKKIVLIEFLIFFCIIVFFDSYIYIL